MLKTKANNTPFLILPKHPKITCPPLVLIGIIKNTLKQISYFRSPCHHKINKKYQTLTRLSNCIVPLMIQMEENQLHLSSVIEVSSPWKEKATSSFLSKIVKMQNDNMALILKQDPNKSLRFIYLSLLMNSRNATYMQHLIAKIDQIKTKGVQMRFQCLPHHVGKIIPGTLIALHGEMHQLAKKLQNHSYSHNAILKLSHEFALIDPLLIAALRTVAEDCKMSNALNWNMGLGMNQTQALMSNLAMQKGIRGLSGRNKYVLFHPQYQLPLQHYQKKGVQIAKESQCLFQLSDSHTIKYQDFMMIEKVYSLL